ncbi:MAG: hypothetical protein E6Q34_08670 [Burkholderiaceae bacterium]|nr:MAG: hypothetical protein E6Q34_08670 [Burkholderiaceae bacterium]
MNRSADAEVLLHLVATEMGGKNRPVKSGYRPVYAIREDYWTSTNHDFLDVVEFAPGQIGRAHVWFLSPEVYPKSLWVGREMSVAEGNRVVGKAVVVKVLNPLLVAEKN